MTDDARVIDLEAEFWNSLNQAAAESNWIPQEHYFMNDWVSDCCDFLRNGPQLPEPFATIPDPEAYIAAARGVREALGAFVNSLTSNGTNNNRCLSIVHDELTACLAQSEAALLAFDAAQGEQ